jgi:hypothetical protein
MLCSLVLTGLPMVAVGWFQSSAVESLRNGSADPFAPIVRGTLFLPITLITNALLQAAIIHGTVNDLNGRRASLQDSLVTALRLLLPMIGIAILVGVIMVLGFVAFLIPGVIAALAFAVSVPVEVVERHGVIASMGRSVELTKNHRWAILGLFVLFTIASLIVGMVGGVFSAFVGNLTPLGFERTSYLVVTPLAQSLVAMIGAAGVAAVYYELRSIKEGIGPEALAAVFD